MRRPKYTPEETQYADVVRTFDSFPGFELRDFEAFEEEKQRDPRKNGERLLVKRKLDALGKAIEAAKGLPKKLGLVRRTSLSHPFNHNGFRVAAQSVYWGRGDQEKAVLKRELGAILGADADPAYLGVTLLVEVSEPRLAVGLRLHPKAWWDAKRIRERTLKDEGLRELTDLLNGLPAAFEFGITGFKRRYPTGSLRPLEMAGALRFFKPGEHGLEVLWTLAPAAAVERGAELTAELLPLLRGLGDLLLFMRWSKKVGFA